MTPYWRRMFDDWTLEKGEYVYQDDAIHDVRILEERIEGKASGTYEYEVSADLDGDEVVSVSCSCPQAQKEDYCKHQVALLLYVENLEDEEALAEYEEAWPERADISSLIEEAPEVEVRRLLFEISSQDSRLADIIRLRLGGRNEHAAVKSRLLTELDTLLKGYYRGSKASGLSFRLCEYVDVIRKEFLTAGLQDMAAELIARLLSSIAGWPFSGSAYVYGELEDLTEDILASSTPETAEKSIRVILPCISLWDAGSAQLLRILCAHITSRELLEETLSRTEAELGRAIAYEERHSAYSFGTERSIAVRLYEECRVLCSRLGRDESSLREYSDKLKESISFSLRKVEEFLSAGRYKEAEELLVYHLRLRSEGGKYIPPELFEKLVTLCNLTGEKQKLCSVLQDKLRLTAYGTRDDLMLIQHLSSEEEWAECRSEMISRLPLKERLDYLMDEGDVETLAEVVLSGHDPALLLRYGSLLAPGYSAEYAEAFAVYASEVVQAKKSSAAYNEVSSNLVAAAEFCGEEKIRRILQGLMEAYPNRPALVSCFSWAETSLRWRKEQGNKDG